MTAARRVHFRDPQYPQHEWPRCGGGGINRNLTLTTDREAVTCQLCLQFMSKAQEENPDAPNRP